MFWPFKTESDDVEEELYVEKARGPLGSKLLRTLNEAGIDYEPDLDDEDLQSELDHFPDGGEVQIIYRNSNNDEIDTGYFGRGVFQELRRREPEIAELLDAE